MASTDNTSDLGIEASLFKTADKLRGNMEPSDYMHVALGLIFLKHISDSFDLKRQALLPALSMFGHNGPTVNLALAF